MSPPDSAAPTASRIPWWLWPNVLSLDAPLVAVAWQAALAKMCKIAVMPALHITLFLAVWLIYIVDRVLDGFSMHKAARISARHAFYQRNRWLYLFFVIPIASVLLLLLALTAIPEGILWRGVALGFVVALYLLHYAARGHQGIYIMGNLVACAIGGFVLWQLPLPVPYQLLYSTVLLGLLLLAMSGRVNQGFRLLPKELLCGYLFAVGCSLGVSFLTLDSHGTPFSLETLMLALLCALNCIAISYYERETDAHSDPNSIAQTWPHIGRVYPSLLLMAALVAVFAFTLGLRTVELLLYPAAVLLSTALLAVVHHLAKRLTPDLAHVLADAAVVAPVALIMMA